MQFLNANLVAGVSRLQAVVASFGYAMLFLYLKAQGAIAAPDPTTGIDYKVDLADPVLDSAKPAIVAGLAILAIIAAVTLGKKLWGKVSH